MVFFFYTDDVDPQMSETSKGTLTFISLFRRRKQTALVAGRNTTDNDLIHFITLSSPIQKPSAEAILRAVAQGGRSVVVWYTRDPPIQHDNSILLSKLRNADHNLRTLKRRQTAEVAVGLTHSLSRTHEDP